MIVPCAACGRPATCSAEVAACGAHQPLVAALLTLLQVDEVSPVAGELSQRRLTLLQRARHLARALADCVAALSDADVPEESLEAVGLLVENLWRVAEREAAEPPAAVPPRAEKKGNPN